jgi:hypothetical protein
MKLNVPRALSLYLAWMGLTCGTLVAGIGGLLPFGLGSIGPDAAFLGSFSSSPCSGLSSCRVSSFPKPRRP